MHAQPSRCDSICDVDELIGEKTIEVVEYLGFENGCVQLSHAIHMITKSNTKICHPNAFGRGFFEDANGLAERRFVWKCALHFLH